MLSPVRVELIGRCVLRHASFNEYDLCHAVTGSSAASTQGRTRGRGHETGHSMDVSKLIGRRASFIEKVAFYWEELSTEKICC